MKKASIFLMLFVASVSVADVWVTQSNDTWVVTETKFLWHTDYDTAMAEAKATGKLLIVDFYKVPCLPCDRLDVVFRDSQVTELLKNYVCVKVREGELSNRIGVHQFPTVIICDGDGTIYREDVGAASVETMVERLKAPKVLRQAYVLERPTTFLSANCSPRG